MVVGQVPKSKRKVKALLHQKAFNIVVISVYKEKEELEALVITERRPCHYSRFWFGR